MSDSPSSRGRGLSSAAWLLAQVGAHAAAGFAGRLAAIDLTPPQAGILRAISRAGGLSQRALAEQLDILPSRLVSFMDELERRGLVERRNNLEDRRTYALHLTEAGTKALAAIGRIAREHQDALCAALTPEERETLSRLLQRIAGQQGLTAGVHPGFGKL
jgi:DNA-binding MarR family transcriptional regulator